MVNQKDDVNIGNLYTGIIPCGGQTVPKQICVTNAEWKKAQKKEKKKHYFR